MGNSYRGKVILKTNIVSYEIRNNIFAISNGIANMFVVDYIDIEYKCKGGSNYSYQRLMKYPHSNN